MNTGIQNIISYPLEFIMDLFPFGQCENVNVCLILLERIYPSKESCLIYKNDI